MYPALPCFHNRRSVTRPNVVCIVYMSYISSYIRCIYVVYIVLTTSEVARRDLFHILRPKTAPLTYEYRCVRSSTVGSLSSREIRLTREHQHQVTPPATLSLSFSRIHLRYPISRDCYACAQVRIRAQYTRKSRHISYLGSLSRLHA